MRAELVTVALTGDGKTEANILRAMAERYNGAEHALKLPENIALLGHGNRKTEHLTGYSTLRAVQTYVTKFGFAKFVFLMDVEHVETPKNMCSEISERLKALGFSSPNIEILTSQAFLVSCNLGSNEVSIHVVIAGKRSVSRKI
jgi:hypothetical protein